MTDNLHLEEDILMPRKLNPRTPQLRAVTVVVALFTAASVLGACHTTAGAGEDISQTGQAIKHSAQQNTP